ncbi:MAG: restriction endonuclease subunit S [Lentisphaeria bacterium]|nr:restriction endonuclease subunit S [Lentisphaeria bacterium]
MNHNAPMVKLGDLIDIFETKNVSGHDYPFCGVNRDKTFMPTVADTNELDNTKYKIISQDMFVFSGMQTGRDICIRLALYDREKPVLISPAYTTFVIKNKGSLLPKFFYMFFNRYEMDRYGAFLSDGSIRSNLDWDRFCEIEIPLPSIEVQRSLVAIYDGLQKIISENETLIQQLESVCHDFVVDCKYKYPKVKLGEWIEIQEKRNEEGNDYPFSGVNKNKSFMPTVADTNELDNTKYKVVSKDMFVFSGMQTGRDECIRLALCDEETPILISPAYTTFVIKEKDLLLPLYFFMVFCRSEMDRYGAFLSDGSIRSNLDWERFCEIEIPLPPIEVQRSIATVAHSLQESKRIIQDAKDLMKNICPALVQKAAHSA